MEIPDPIDDLRAWAVILAAVIAAREAADRLGITAAAEVIADDGALSLVVSPVATLTACTDAPA